MTMRQSAVSRRLLLRTAALSPLALACSRERASEATGSTVAAAPADATELCDTKQLTEAIAMLWQKFFEGAQKQIDPECFGEAVVLFYDTLCWNMACWGDQQKQDRALLCAHSAGSEAAKLANQAQTPMISKQQFIDACNTIKGLYRETCERAGQNAGPGIVCG